MIDIDKEARKRVARKKKFYQHLGSYISVIGFLFILNMVTSPFHWWFIYPMLGWGLGLAIDYMSTFGVPGTNMNDENWERQEYEKEKRRLSQSQGHEMPPRNERLELKELERQRRGGKYDQDDLV